MDAYEMYAVKIQRSIPLLVLPTKYTPKKVLTRRPKNQAVSQSYPVDRHAGKKKQTDSQIQKEEYVLKVIISASTNILTEDALVALKILDASMDYMVSMYADGFI